MVKSGVSFRCRDQALGDDEGRAIEAASVPDMCKCRRKELLQGRTVGREEKAELQGFHASVGFRGALGSG